jgi:hypothetical protein
MHYLLDETVWDLYCYGGLKGLESYAPTLKQLMAADRALTKPPRLESKFCKDDRKEAQRLRDQMLGHICFGSCKLDLQKTVSMSFSSAWL